MFKWFKPPPKKRAAIAFYITREDIDDMQPGGFTKLTLPTGEEYAMMELSDFEAIIKRANLSFKGMAGAKSNG